MNNESPLRNETTDSGSFQESLVSPQPEEIVLRTVALDKSYQQGPQRIEVLKNINLAIRRGERVAIIGSSGSGKSTLLNMLGGLDLPDSGSVEVQGQNLSSLSEKQRGDLRNQYLGFVYQFHHLLAEFTALENVAMPLFIRGLTRRAATDAAEDILARVGLADRLVHKPSELSGGERQRVAIARALVTEPSCVLMDEPTGNLDQGNAESVQNLMLELNRAFQTSFVIVTHDTHLAEKTDRILQLQQGELREL